MITKHLLFNLFELTRTFDHNASSGISKAIYIRQMFNHLQLSVTKLAGFYHIDYCV